MFSSSLATACRSLPSQLLPPLLRSVSPVSGLSGGNTRLGGVCLLLVASASCLLHGLQILPPSSFLPSVTRFCCRRCRAAFGDRISKLHHPIRVWMLPQLRLVSVIAIVLRQNTQNHPPPPGRYPKLGFSTAARACIRRALHLCNLFHKIFPKPHFR